MTQFTDYVEKNGLKVPKIEKKRIESEKARQAFACYVNLGPSRSYPKVATAMGVSPATVSTWGARFNWASRVAEVETMSTEIAEQDLGMTYADRKAQTLAIIQMLKDDFKQGVADKKIQIKNVNEFVTLTKLEAVLHGKPSDINENRNLNAIFQATTKAGEFLGIGEAVKDANSGREDVVDAEFEEGMQKLIGVVP